MIKKNNKTIEAVYHGSTPIEKIYKGTTLVYEAWKNLTATGVPPLTLEGCKNTNLLDYKIYGNSKQGKLPVEYQEVEYIESTGTQYIDTGIKLNQDSKIITEIQLTNDGSQPNAMFGSRTSSTENNFECVSSSSSNVGIRIDFQSYETNRLTTEFNNEKNYIVISKTLMQIGERTKRQISYTDFETPSNCYIFYVSGKNIYGQKAQMRLYNFKIYQNDVLIKDFIPCYKKINNEIGLYDLVSNTFFTNAGTGEFLKGNSVQEKLPNIYQRVEYIESTGTQYIDTGIIPISSTRIDINFAYVGTTGYAGWVPIFGARSIIDNVQEYYAVFINNSTLKLTTNYSSRDFGDNSNVYIEANKKYNLKNNQGSFYINDILESSISTSDTLSNNTRYPVYLFDLNFHGSRMNRGTKTKIYSCKFYDDDTLIRNYIPCYRKSDNEIGLYDTVNNVFYTNQGTGVFLKGSNAPTPYVPIEIESVGDLITDTNDINYGKYKIPVTVNNITTNIYLNEPLRKIGDFADYLDYKNGKVVRNIYHWNFGSNTFDSIDLVSDNTLRCAKNHYLGAQYRPKANTSFNINSNILPTGNGTTYSSDSIGIYYVSLDKGIQLWARVPHTENNVVSEVNDLFNGNYADYALNTPIEESITLPNIVLNKGTNIIDVDTTIKPSNMYVEYKGGTSQ